MVGDIDLGYVNREGLPRGVPPCIQCDAFRCLAFYREGAWASSSFRRCPVPPLEVAKGFLDIAAGEFVLD